MAGDQKNFDWYRYVDDAARNWAVRAEVTWAARAISGLTTFNSADPPFGHQTRRRHERKVVYRDPNTFRTTGGPVGTTAAFAALPATITNEVIGVATPVTFNLSAKVPEKMPIPSTSRKDADIP